MAQKEIKVKVTVYNQELEVTRQELEKLNKEAHITKEVFNEASQELKKLEDEAKGATTEVKSLGEQIGKVEDKMGDLILKGQQNTKEFKELQKESRKLKGAQEEMQIASQKSLDTFAAMPGPIGLIGKTFKDLSVTAKLAKTGLQAMGLGFNTLGKAMLSSGVGAIVVLIGLLATAVIKALSSFKPLTSAFDRFGKTLEVVGKVLDPIVETIGNLLVKALDKLAYAMAFVTGSLDEYNKAMADSAAAEKMEANTNKMKTNLELLGDTYDEQKKKTIQAEIEKNDRLKALREDDTKDASQKAQEKKMIEERYQRDVAAIQKEADDKAKEERQKAYDEWKKKKEEREAIERDFQNRLLGLENEFATLSEENEFERQRITLDQQLKGQEAEIEQLKISASKKEQLLDQLSENYKLKLQAINDAETQVAIDKEKERQESITTLRKNYSKQIEDIEADTAEKKLALDKQRAMAELELLGATEEQKLELIKYYDLQEVELAKQRNQEKLDAEKEYNDLVMQAKYQLLDATIAAAGQETAIGRSLAAFKALMAFQETMIELKRISFKGTKAVAEAGIDAASNVSASSKIGFPQNLITIAAAIAQGVALVSAVKSAVSSAKGGGGGGTGGAPAGQNLGQNYERGGFIRGRRHAQGGVMAELEGGEAVMTRGAVAAFGPMLSMMNQMGGGVSFSSDVSQSGYDNPKTTNYAKDEGSIIKTYVVEQELTTAQQRQARLKELSTL